MLLGTNTGIRINLFLDGNKSKNSEEVDLIEIFMDNNLSLKTHIENICRKAKYKLHALQLMRKYLSTDKAKTICNVFMNSQLYVINLDVCREIVNLKST